MKGYCNFQNINDGCLSLGIRQDYLLPELKEFTIKDDGLKPEKVLLCENCFEKMIFVEVPKAPRKDFKSLFSDDERVTRPYNKVILDQIEIKDDLKEKIKQEVKRNPGIHIEGLLRAVGVSQSRLERVVREMPDIKKVSIEAALNDGKRVGFKLA